MPTYAIGEPTFKQSGSGAYEASRKAASNTSSPGQFSDFPDWMPQSPNMGGLNALQQNLGSFFNPRPMLRQTNRAANFILDSQRAAGQAAATAYANRAMQSGGSSQGAGFAAASAMLPAFNQANMMRMDAQRLAAQMRGNQAQLSAGIGSSIGGLSNQHAGLLSDYAARQQALQMQSRGMDFEHEKWDYSTRLQRQLQAANSGGRGPASAFNGQITRAPNNGGGGKGVEYTPEYLDYLNASGVRPGAGPASYPMEGGITGGIGLDRYNAAQRAMFAQANPGMSSYNFGMTPDILNLNTIENMDGRVVGTPAKRRVTIANL